MPQSHLSQIGVIIAGSAPPIEGFKEGLAELGLVEGTNIHLELGVAQGQLDRLPAFAAEMVRLQVDVIAVIGAVTVHAAPGDITIVKGQGQRHPTLVRLPNSQRSKLRCSMKS